MSLWKMELLESVTKDELRRLDGLALDPNFKASPAVKNGILKAALECSRRQAEQNRQSKAEGTHCGRIWHTLDSLRTE